LQAAQLVTFQFLHANTDHLIFNMLGLWFIGGMVESALGRRRYLAFYLVCGISGALMFLFLNLLGWGFHLHLPGLLFADPYTPLIGASAGVFGVRRRGILNARPSTSSSPSPCSSVPPCISLSSSR
jgi:membrane associated rhomboid family serine protease